MSCSHSKIPSNIFIWPIERFEKDYNVIESIGQGQYGEVFSAVSTNTEQKKVAVKFMKCQKASEKLRVRDEIDILKDLNHPNVIKIFGAYEDHDQFILTLEHLRYNFFHH